MPVARSTCGWSPLVVVAPPPSITRQMPTAAAGQSCGLSLAFLASFGCWPCWVAAIGPVPRTRPSSSLPMRLLHRCISSALRSPPAAATVPRRSDGSARTPRVPNRPRAAASSDASAFPVSLRVTWHATNTAATPFWRDRSPIAIPTLPVKRPHIRRFVARWPHPPLASTAARGPCRHRRVIIRVSAASAPTLRVADRAIPASMTSRTMQ